MPSDLETTRNNTEYASDQESNSSENSTLLSPTWELPPEIQIAVFSHLSPTDLDKASLVCRQWHEVLNKEASWRESFSRIFLITRFNRVTSSLKWRTELVSRLEYIRKWRKGTAKNLSFNCHIPITNVFSDLGSARIAVFSTTVGMGAIADPTKGKLAKPFLYTDKNLQSTNELTSLAGSRFGIVFGFVTGIVKCLLYSQETRIRDYYVMKERHFGAVTATWINKLESPKSSTKFDVITGSEDGQLLIWDVLKGTAQTFNLGTSPICKIECDSRGIIVVACQDGSIFIRAGDNFEAVGGIPGAVKHFVVDFDAEYIVAGSDHELFRFQLAPSGARHAFDMHVGPVTGKITAFNVDNTPASTTGANKDTPGQHGRYLAAATTTDHVLLWLLQTDADENGLIARVRTRDSPFQVEVPTLPGVTAIALNSAVMLLGSYNGVTIAYDLLTGEYLRVVSARFSKRALNFRVNEQPPEHGLYPITHLEVDADASNPHGIIVVGRAVQYFDFGASFDESSEKKRGIRKVKRAPYYSGSAYTPTATSKVELSRDIENDIKMMKLEDTEYEQNQEDNWSREVEFAGEGLDEEDQLALAMMLSQEQANASAIHATSSQADIGGSEDEDEDLNRAIRLSLGEQQQSSFEQSPEILPRDIQFDEDRQVDQAIAISLLDDMAAAPSTKKYKSRAKNNFESEKDKQPNQVVPRSHGNSDSPSRELQSAGDSSWEFEEDRQVNQAINRSLLDDTAAGPSTKEFHSAGDSGLEIDEDINRAIAISLLDDMAAAPATKELDPEEDHDLNLAIKLSMQEH